MICFFSFLLRLGFPSLRQARISSKLGGSTTSESSDEQRRAHGGQEGQDRGRAGSRAGGRAGGQAQGSSSQQPAKID